jgi:uncharacterized C2H2 Zn-finger protein
MVSTLCIVGGRGGESVVIKCPYCAYENKYANGVKVCDLLGIEFFFRCGKCDTLLTESDVPEQNLYDEVDWEENHETIR